MKNRTPPVVAYASNLRPAISLFEPANLDEAPNRTPQASQVFAKARARGLSSFVQIRQTVPC